MAEITAISVYDSVDSQLCTAPIHNVDGMHRMVSKSFFCREIVVGELSLLSTPLWTSKAQRTLDRRDPNVSVYVTLQHEITETKVINVRVIDRVTVNLGNISIHTYRLFMEKVDPLMEDRDE